MPVRRKKENFHRETQDHEYHEERRHKYRLQLHRVRDNFGAAATPAVDVPAVLIPRSPKNLSFIIIARPALTIGNPLSPLQSLKLIPPAEPPLPGPAVKVPAITALVPPVCPDPCQAGTQAFPAWRSIRKRASQQASQLRLLLRFDLCIITVCGTVHRPDSPGKEIP